MKVTELLIGTCPAFGSKEDVSVAKLIIMTFNFWSGVPAYQMLEQKTNQKPLHFFICRILKIFVYSLKS
jgi:hypothetical protein